MTDRIDTETLVNLLRPLKVHQRISMLRKLHNMSQTDLADALEVQRVSVSSWEAEPDRDRSHMPGPETRDRMGYLFRIPAYVLTPDYGMQNFKQAGTRLSQIEREAMDAGSATEPEPRPRREQAPTISNSGGPIDPPPATEQGWHEQVADPAPAPAPDPVEAQPRPEDPTAALEGRAILHSQREEVQARVESTPIQIPNPAPKQQSDEGTPPPPPEGVIRIG